MKKRHLFVLLTVVLTLSMILAACGGAAEPTEAPAAEAPAAEAPAAEAPAAPANEMAEAATAKGLTELANAYNGMYSGTVVSMNGPFTDEDAVKFDSSIAAFEAATGIDIQYEGSKEFETSIRVRVEANDPPDIADFPQPGLMTNFARQGKIIPATTLVPETWLAQNYLQSWRDMATVDGTEYGVWHRFNAKSLVWYPKAAFDASGYTIPTTWEELQALQDQIVADGDTPWCVGIESGTATGWPATDWTEEFMLRTTSLDNYDAWVLGDLPFASPEVKNAIETFAGIWNDSAMVYGGTPAIVTTFFGDAPTPMFQDPPNCWLHKQGNFITSFFPQDKVYGTDYGVFYLPGVDPAYGKPFLVAGDVMSAFRDRPEVRAVMQFFSTGEAIRGWLAAGGALGMQKDVELEWYGNPVERDIAALVNDATAVRFDASDLMPGEVGSGSFWEGMVNYFSGAADLDTVLAEIDASWPR
jgi:alpha-glucoside transport system substrate-binding protein